MTPDRDSHYYLQKARRVGFLEDWRAKRRELAQGRRLRLEDSPMRRARVGMLVGEPGGVPTRMIDARVIELPPGQLTSTHRHLHDAVIFVIEGHGVTTVDGAPYEWAPWDALHTPAWSWHRHQNPDPARPARLLAITDWPLLRALGLPWIEDVGLKDPPLDVGRDLTIHGVGLYEEELAQAGRAQAERAAGRKITRFKDLTFRVSPRGTRTTLLVDRSLGFRTSGLSMAMFEIPPGKAQARHRHPGEAILYIVDGKGYSLIDDTRCDWETGDAVLVNRYCWHQHVNADLERPAVVIRMHMWESVIEIMQAAMDPIPLYEDDPAVDAEPPAREEASPGTIAGTQRSTRRQ